MNDDADVTVMTVNERLAYFQLFDALDTAVASRKLSDVTKVLLEAKLPSNRLIKRQSRYWIIRRDIRFVNRRYRPEADNDDPSDIEFKKKRNLWLFPKSLVRTI